MKKGSYNKDWSSKALLRKYRKNVQRDILEFAAQVMVGTADAQGRGWMNTTNARLSGTDRGSTLT